MVNLMTDVVRAMRTMATETSTLVDFNPFKAEFSQNLYPTYHALRECNPVFAVLGCQGRDWIVTSFEHARFVLTDSRFIVEDLRERVQKMASSMRAERSVEGLCKTLATWLFFVNEPAHGCLRRVLAPAFSKEGIYSLRVQIAGIVQDLVRPALVKERIDVITDIACLLPARVSAAILDFKQASFSELAALSSEVFGLFTQPLSLRRYQAIDASIRKLNQHIEVYLKAQRIHPTSSVALAIIEEMDSGRLSVDQAVALCNMIFSVGQDTTQNLIGNAVNVLLNHPLHESAVRKNPELLPAMVREVARFDSPVQLVLRIASEEIALGGKTIKEGERVHVYLGAALRDPAAFLNPDEFDFHRPFQSSLPFGAGIHFCLGFHLAQLQTEIALESMMQHLPVLRSTGEPPRWIRSVHIRGLQSLPLLATQ